MVSGPNTFKTVAQWARESYDVLYLFTIEEGTITIIFEKKILVAEAGR
jgi:hypothetical protein